MHPPLKENFLVPLVFFDLFDHPLTFDELQQWTPGNVGFSKETLLAHPLLGSKNGHYFLKNRGHLVNIREERQKISAEYWKKVTRYVPFLQLVPFIRMVAVCNTMAFGHPTKESDIDLFVIVRHDRLLTARILSTFLFAILGIRRHGTKIAGRFCLSFYISDESLDLNPIRQQEDLYLTYWVASLKPVLGKEAARTFLRSNPWASDFFQHQLEADFTQHAQPSWKEKIGKFCEWMLEGRWGDWIEAQLWKWQEKRHSKNASKLGKESSVIVTKAMLKFHNIDRRRELNEKFRRRFSELSVS